ncbi:hypothetical protein [Nocardia amamiensis]|uniref:hypothetical protein n=1 Tax=Nocardia amamiensis TaxID=404578 RepID=UPI00082D6409|nr:hypothetical protein [Nocardia amamiensis]
MTVLFLAPLAAAAAYPLGALAVHRHLRHADALTPAQRRAAAATWPRLLAHTILRRRRYARAGRKCAATADFLTRLSEFGGFEYAEDATEFVNALRTVGQLPTFGVFLRDTATGAPFDQPAEPALVAIQAAAIKADEIRKQYGR